MDNYSAEDVIMDLEERLADCDEYDVKEFLTARGQLVTILTNPVNLSEYRGEDLSFSGVNWVAIPMLNATTIVNLLLNIRTFAELDSMCDDAWKAVFGPASDAVFNLCTETEDKYAYYNPDGKCSTVSGKEFNIIKTPCDVEPGITINVDRNITRVSIPKIISKRISNAERTRAVITKHDACLLYDFLTSTGVQMLVGFAEEVAIRVLKSCIHGDLLRDDTANVTQLFKSNSKCIGNIYSYSYNAMINSKPIKEDNEND